MTFGTLTLAFGSLLALGGCCQHNSLVRAGLSEREMERLVSKRLEGVHDRNEQFSTVAAMVDWSPGGFANRESWLGMPVVGWDFEMREMTIPDWNRCYMGNISSGQQIAIRFDEAGNLQSVRSKSYQWMDPELPPVRWARNKQFFQDSDYRRVFVLGTASDPIRFTRIYQPGSRLIELDVVGDVPAGVSNPLIKIHTEPEIELELVLDEGPEVFANDLAGAYIVQNPDFMKRSGGFRYQTATPYRFVPDQALYYRCVIRVPSDITVDVWVEILTEGDA